MNLNLALINWFPNNLIPMQNAYALTALNFAIWFVSKDRMALANSNNLRRTSLTNSVNLVSDEAIFSEFNVTFDSAYLRENDQFWFGICKMSLNKLIQEVAAAPPSNAASVEQFYITGHRQRPK